MELLPGKAHLWTMSLEVVGNKVEAPSSDPLIDELELVLSEDERSRSRRFHFENNRREYIAAHALCRIMLSKFSTTAPQEWSFTAGPHGKPEIAGDGSADTMRFNISHTKGMVCLGVTLNDDIGVDVEWTGRNNRIEDIARFKFSKPEVTRLIEMPQSEKRKGFFMFWTLKEAYIKATGKGLAEPLDGFAFSLKPVQVEFLNGQDDPLNWHFQPLELAPDYIGALAVRCGRKRDLDVTQQMISGVELVRLAGMERR